MAADNDPAKAFRRARLSGADFTGATSGDSDRRQECERHWYAVRDLALLKARHRGGRSE